MAAKIHKLKIVKIKYFCVELFPRVHSLHVLFTQLDAKTKAA